MNVTITEGMIKAAVAAIKDDGRGPPLFYRDWEELAVEVFRAMLEVYPDNRIRWNSLTDEEKRRAVAMGFLA